LAVEGGTEPVDSALEVYRWMLEEYRVSLFAQELGTEGRISEKRLARQWATVTPST
jgi:ATP-dependent helicase HrpA